MKQHTFLRRSAIFVIALLFLVPSGAAALDYSLSPGLDIIKSRVEVKKCGVMNTPVLFSETDFDPVLGKAEYITLMTLPEKNEGLLSIGSSEAAAGQTITRRSLDSMKFTPAKDRTVTVSFTFKDASKEEGAYGVCTLFILEGLNLAPVPADSSFETLRDISYKGYLNASDPEGDAMTFSIQSNARHGTLQLLDKSEGYFMYTPRKDFTGRDLFSFRVTDMYGNVSPVMKVVLHVTAPESDTVFADMTNHWAHASAIKLAQAGLMYGTQVNGQNYFEPDKSVSRGDFLAVAMIAAGYEDMVQPVAKTDFSDDSDIPVNIKSYAQTALEMGIISGYPDENGGVAFESGRTITRSEASCILSRLLIPETQITGEITGNSTVPVWANASFSSLMSRGILKGTGSGNLAADSCMTRAQLAQIYCNVKDYTDERKAAEQEKPPRTLWNLFGLLP